MISPEMERVLEDMATSRGLDPAVVKRRADIIELAIEEAFDYTPSKQREGDQDLPDGDATIVDDQQLLIDDIVQRRQVGIDRYGQGHRPFNGRDTLEDLYEEQLDLLVYLRSIKRMHEASAPEVISEIAAVLKTNGFQDIVCYAMAEDVYKRIQGWLASTLINGGEK